MAERHRYQIDFMIDEMVTAGKSEQDILAAIVAQYRPYDSLPAEFQCLPDERHPYDDAPVGKNPLAACKRQVNCPSVRPRRQRRRVAFARAAAHEATGKVISETSASAAMPSLLRTL